LAALATNQYLLKELNNKENYVQTWAPAQGEQGGQAPTLEKIRVGMAHPGNFSRG